MRAEPDGRTRGAERAAAVERLAGGGLVFVDDGWNNYDVPTWASKLVLQKEEDIEHIQGVAIERYHGDTYESMEDTIEFSAFMSCYRFARFILEGMYRCPNDFEIPDNRE